MKKIILALSASVVMLGASSCCDSKSCSAEDKAFADSLSAAYSSFVGSQLKNQMGQFKMQFGQDFDEDEFLKGYKAAANLDSANIAYMVGYSFGIQNVFQVASWNKVGVKADPKVAAENIIKAYKDSLANIQQAYAEFQRLNGELRRKAEVLEQERKAAEVKKNIAAGEEYIAKLMAEDKDIVKSESGLYYKIIAAGEETKPGEFDNVSVLYEGRHIDGSAFDTAKDKPVEFNLARVVKGFAEGIRLLGKGGKAVLYIPGDLGYGEDGHPMGGIEPNEMLVFDVELVDFSTPEAKD